MHELSATLGIDLPCAWRWMQDSGTGLEMMDQFWHHSWPRSDLVCRQRKTARSPRLPSEIGNTVVNLHKGTVQASLGPRQRRSGRDRTASHTVRTAIAYSTDYPWRNTVIGMWAVSISDSHESYNTIAMPQTDVFH